MTRSSESTLEGTECNVLLGMDDDDHPDTLTVFLSIHLFTLVPGPVFFPL